jgi:tRNA/tmRNA/rRNA uracil-C5-methylase (TrmA/RlmC/RlmD family)
VIESSPDAEARYSFTETKHVENIPHGQVRRVVDFYPTNTDQNCEHMQASSSAEVPSEYYRALCKAKSKEIQKLKERHSQTKACHEHEL